MDKFSIIAEIVALVFFAALAWDICMTVWSKFRKKEYAWISVSWFAKTDSGWIAMLIAVVVVFGAYSWLEVYANEKVSEIESKYESTEEEDTVPAVDATVCPYCFEQVPIRYMFEAYDGDPICADCLRNDINAAFSGEIRVCWMCDNFFADSNMSFNGLCDDCMDTSAALCYMCADYALVWDEENDYHLCTRCTDILCSDVHMLKEMETWFFGE